MNRRIWVILISLTLLGTCIFCGVFLLLYFGLAFDRGPFSSESQAQFLIRFRGGTRILIQVDVPRDATVQAQAMEATRSILQKRLNALGTQSIVRTQGERNLTIELPGDFARDQAASVIGTGLLEFIDADETPLTEGETVKTTGWTAENSCTVLIGQNSATQIPTSAAPPTLSTPEINSAQVYTTVMTGACLETASVSSDQTGRPEISFSLRGNGAKILADFTGANVGRFLPIVVDKKVLSSPRIEEPITGGKGVITGQFTMAQANDLAIQLRYGALPIPLKIVEVTAIPK